MLRYKRSYDAFSAGTCGGFGYNAHARVNVEDLKSNDMDVMDFVPSAKRSKLDDESLALSKPSTQASISHINSDSTSSRLSTTASDALDPKKWLRALPRARRHRHELIGTIGCVGKNDSVFSIDDVTNILTAALKEQEESLNNQFQNVLGERIAEVVREYEREKEELVRSRFTSNNDTSYYS